LSLVISVASGFVVSKFGNLKPTTIGTIIASVGFFVLFIFHSTETSIATVLILLAIGLSLMQIGSVNVVLTSTPKQFSGISLGMNLLIYLIGSAVGPRNCWYNSASSSDNYEVISSISTSYPSPESYSVIFLVAALISLSSVIFAILLNRKGSNQGRTSRN
jgi:MFS family permease